MQKHNIHNEITQYINIGSLSQNHKLHYNHSQLLNASNLTVISSRNSCQHIQKCTQHTMLNSITLGSQHYIQFIKVKTIHKKLQLWNLKSDNYCCVDICTFSLKLLHHQNVQHGTAFSLSYWYTMYELHQLWHLQCIATVCCVGWGGLLPSFSVFSMHESCISSCIRHTAPKKPPYSK